MKLIKGKDFAMPDGRKGTIVNVGQKMIVIRVEGETLPQSYSINEFQRMLMTDGKLKDWKKKEKDLTKHLKKLSKTKAVQNFLKAQKLLVRVKDKLHK